MTKDMIKFDLPKNQSSIIKVIGVGGGGSNAVNHMFSQGIEGVDFFVCNTDSQALELSPVPNKMQLGINLTEGRGAGSIPEIGRNAAIEDIERIREILQKNTKMLFITAGMGGGTGTGAAPIIAKTAKEMGILTVGIVTIPFAFEGRKRRQQAEEGIREMKSSTDTLLVICNDRLRELYGNLSVSDAFGRADNVLATAAKGIAEIITLTGNINVDFADVKTVMSDSGVAIMGSGSAEGENRATIAVSEALISPLLNDNQIKGAKNILLNITSGDEEILMDEISEITDYIQHEAGSSAEIIWGLGKDATLGIKINITLVATGFGMNNNLSAELERPEVVKKVMSLDSVNDDHHMKTANDFLRPSEFIQQEVEGIRLMIRKDAAKDHESNAGTEKARQTSEEFHHQKYGSHAESNSEESKKEGVDPKTGRGSLMNQGASPRTFSNPAVEEEIRKKITERELRLRELSVRIKSPEGLSDLEKQPAYVRRNVLLSQVPSSAEPQVSRYTLHEDENKQIQIKSNNSFLHDNVD